MNLLQLQYFLAVCQEENFTRAAAKIHVTQPTLTKAIKELEKEFQVPLLYRGRHGVLPTTPGETLLSMAVPILQETKYLQQVMESYASSQQVLRLGTTFMTNVSCFPSFYQCLHERFPKVEVNVTSDLTHNLLPKLENGQVNLLLVPYPPENCRYPYFLWCTRRFLFVVPENHPLANREKVGFKDICHEPLISYFGDQYLMRHGLPEKFKKAGGELKIIHRCNQIQIMQELIRKGLGCGFMMEDSFKPGDGVVGLPLEDEFTTNVYVIWNKESQKIFFFKDIIKYLQRQAKEKNKRLQL